jgi:biotin operon repressor
MKIPFFRKLPLSTHQVLEALSDGKFHSGLDLAIDLNISRTAIWKIIKNLQNYQLFIEKHRRKGYQLKIKSDTSLSISNINPKSGFCLNLLDLLDEEKISKNLSLEARDELEIFIYDYNPLTHWAKRFFEHRRPLTDISLCLLESQGNPPTPFGKNIHAAIGFSLSKPLIKSSQLDLLLENMGDSVAEILSAELKQNREDSRSIKITRLSALEIQFIQATDAISPTANSIQLETIQPTDNSPRAFYSFGTLKIDLQPNPHKHFLIICELKLTADLSNRNLFIAKLSENFYQTLTLMREFISQNLPKNLPKNLSENPFNFVHLMDSQIFIEKTKMEAFPMPEKEL